MAQQIINIGDPDKGNGDPLRTAFSKIKQNFAELYNHVSAGVTAGATPPSTPGEGDLWWDTASGRLYVYYGTSWVDASPVDGAGISSTNQLVNGAHTVSLSSVGLTAFPAISNESLFIQASELGSANASIGISAKNNVIVTADILDTAKQWTFGTEGKLTLPAGTTFEYLNAPLTGHGDGLARLDFTLVTDGVETQWAAASANPAGSSYSPGDTFTFDAVFLGIPGASVTIEVLTVGAGGSVENLAFTQPPLYPADIYRDSPINLQVGAESNRWTFGANGKLTAPGNIAMKPGGRFITDGSTGVTGAKWVNFPDAANQGIARVYSDEGNTEVAAITVSNLSDVGIEALDSKWTFGGNGNLTFPDNTVQTTAYLGITNKADNTSATIAVGYTMTRNNLSVRVTNNNNTLDVEINYSSLDNQRLISAYKSYPIISNIYSGRTLKAANNTTWDIIDNLSLEGDSLSFTVTDHSFLKIYRVTVVADVMPGGGALGEAFCIIEELK